MDSDIPAKKAKFECCKPLEAAEEHGYGNVIQEEKDLWADDEFTAEEFDFLQSQVSSEVLNVGTSHTLDVAASEVQKLKEQNYGLEGRIKMLQSTLEKNAQELDRERLEKMSLMEKYSEQQKQQQKLFEKEKERLETCLQFKEQELQAVFGKIAALEQKDKSVVCTSKACNATDIPSGKDKDFVPGSLSRTKLNAQKVDSMIQTENEEKKLSHSLNLWFKKGPSAGLVTSNMLCRAGNLFRSVHDIIHEDKVLQRNKECVGNTLTMPLHSPAARSYTDFTRIALSRLNIEKTDKENVFLDKLPSFQILYLLQQILKECLNVMIGIINGGQQQTPSLSWSNILYKESSRLNILLTSQKLPLSSAVIEDIFSLIERQQVKAFQYLYHVLSLEAVRNILFSIERKERDVQVDDKSENGEKSTHSLVDYVLAASTPLYYEEKCINKSAVEWSLAVLVKSAEYCGERFDSYLPDISVCHIISGKCSLISSWLLLHLLQYLLPFEFLLNHIGKHSSLCIYRSLHELCERISVKGLGVLEMKIMTLVLNLLSGLLSKEKLMFDTSTDCFCLHQLFGIVMKILNSEIKWYTHSQTEKHFSFLQSVMSPFSWLRQLSIFQEQFANSQPIYITLWNDSSLYPSKQH